MTLLVRDEQDIVGEHIEFHLSQGVDFVIATDNRSIDATPKILKEFERQGRLCYIFEGDDNYNQYKWVTRMARMASVEYDADWVINSDADEFWWPISGTLRQVFGQLPAECTVVTAKRTNFVPLGGPPGPFFNRMIYREMRSVNSLGNPLPSKVAHRGNAEIEVAQGNHAVTGIDIVEAHEELIEIFHFPIRSQSQIENKIQKGGAAYERNNDLPATIGSTWRALFEEFKQENNLHRYFLGNCYDNDRICCELAAGEIVRDRRLSDYFTLMRTGSGSSSDA